MKPSTKIESETATERATSESRNLESLDDIVREIANRRLAAEFGESIPGERTDALGKSPDQLETTEVFRDAAEKVGIGSTEGVLGWSTNLETPAHVRRGEVPREVATFIHEDLHRVTSPETLRELTATPALKNLYEGITEYLTGKAVENLHGHSSGECYPEQVRQAERLVEAVGETEIRRYYFQNELRDEVLRAIELLETTEQPGG